MTEPAPKPLNPRQEAFCRHLAEGRSLAESARAAGYAPVSARQRGSELWASAEIQARVAALTAEREAARAVSLDRVCEQLEEIVSGAMERGQYGVAFKALALQVRLLGLDPSARRDQEIVDPALFMAPPLPAPVVRPTPPPTPKQARPPLPAAAPRHPASPVPAASLVATPPLDAVRAQLDAALARASGAGPRPPAKADPGSRRRAA